MLATSKFPDGNFSQAVPGMVLRYRLRRLLVIPVESKYFCFQPPRGAPRQLLVAHRCGLQLPARAKRFARFISIGIW